MFVCLSMLLRYFARTTLKTQTHVWRRASVGVRFIGQEAAERRTQCNLGFHQETATVLRGERFRLECKFCISVDFLISFCLIWCMILTKFLPQNIAHGMLKDAFDQVVVQGIGNGWFSSDQIHWFVIYSSCFIECSFPRVVFHSHRCRSRSRSRRHVDLCSCDCQYVYFCGKCVFRVQGVNKKQSPCRSHVI